MYCHIIIMFIDIRDFWYDVCSVEYGSRNTLLLPCHTLQIWRHGDIGRIGEYGQEYFSIH